MCGSSDFINVVKNIKDWSDWVDAQAGLHNWYSQLGNTQNIEDMHVSSDLIIRPQDKSA